MTPTEVVMLTGYLRAHFPSQPVDEYTTEALEELLAPYPASDCRRAVLNVAERGERWCSPTDIKAEVRRIRNKRVADFGAIPISRDVDPDDTLAYRRALRESIKAIADGTPPPELRAIEAGEQGSMPQEIADRMRGFGDLPDDVAQLRGADR